MKLLLLLLVIAGPALAHPKLDKEVCEALTYLAPMHNLEIKRSIAIAFAESSFQNIISEDGTDYGYFQINKWTGQHFGIDMKRLMRDTWYQVGWHLTILDSKMHDCKHLGKDAWSCYHSKTPMFRTIYAARVNEIYKNLDERKICDD